MTLPHLTTRVNVVLAVILVDVALSKAADCMASSNTLKAQAAMNGINFGVATEASSLSGGFEDLVEQEFNMIVAENDMKMNFMYTASSDPGRGSFDWRNADRLVDFAMTNNMKIRGHTLLWHNAIPSGLSSWSMSQQDWRSWLIDYISTVVRRYKGKIIEWDVVNEVYVHSTIDGEGGANGMRNSFWLQKLGSDYVELCFKAAHEADPSARLYYNDYGAEWSNPKTDIIYTKLMDMKRKGVPVHGMGFQGHISHFHGEMDRYRTNFKKFADAGFELSLTEVDIFQDCMGSSGYFEKQAEIYGEFIKMAIDLQFVNFLVWGLHDGVSWVNTHQHLFPCKGNPLLYDSEMKPKPAYFSVKQTMCDLMNGETNSDDSDENDDSEAGGSGGLGPATDIGLRRIFGANFDRKNGGSPSANNGWILQSVKNYIETKFKDLEGHRRLVVKVGAEFGGNSYPELNIFLDGQLVKTKEVQRSPQWIVAMLDRPISGDHVVKLSYANDDWRSNEGNLIILQVVFKPI